MSTFLMIDTSGTDYSVALARDGELLAYHIERDKSRLAGYLTIHIKQLFDGAEIDLNDLSAISIVSGPGSYTGLRIGYATAKGLCFGLGCPLIELPALDILVSKLILRHRFSPDEVIMPTVKMRPNEIYAGLYSQSGQIIAQPEFYILPDNLDALHFSQNHSITAIGDGCDLLGNLTIVNLKTVSGHFDVRDMTALTNKSYSEKTFSDLATCEPMYIKPPNITTAKKDKFGLPSN